MKTSLILLIAGSLGVTLALASPAAADCGDGVTTNGEACDTGTALCAAGTKNAGAECCAASDCLGGPSGADSCVCDTVRFPGGCNRDDVPGACRCSGAMACMRPMCGDGVSDPEGEQCDGGASAGANTPCLGNLPNSVCATLTGVVVNQSSLLGNSSSVVRCTSDGDCAVNSAATGTLQKCIGNPQCHLATCGDDFVCSDPNCTSGTNSLLSASPGIPGPESCDDSNTSNMDACTSFNFSALVATSLIPDHCQGNICGDGISNMGVEQCDAGAAVCITGAKIGKLCCIDTDCKVGAITGTCSSSTPGVFSAAGNNADNGNQPNNLCRCNCNVPACGDGISDTLFFDECDDGTTSNGPGKFCNKEQRCVGGENGCIDANGNGGCDSNSTENASRLAAALCGGSNPPCVKGTCSMLMCVQNTCGDGIVAGNEMCDDGNTLPANTTSDTCGVSATVCAGLQQVLKPGCSTTVFENDPKSCAPCACLNQLCGDGVTNSSAGEMCDGGSCVCLSTALNAGTPCTKASTCKPPLAGPPGDYCSTVNPLTGGMCNRSDIPDRCRPNCMPPGCGDGVSDSSEQCDTGAGNGTTKPCTSVCTLASCGDGQVCSDPACTSGPNGRPEQCDDGNATNPSSTNTDTCWHQCPGALCCVAAFCGDGVTSANEQCDPPADASQMGCSNMDEAQDAAQEQVAPNLECCYDGEVVEASKQIGPGLIDAEHALVSLVKCKLPNAVTTSACDSWVQKRITRILTQVSAAKVYTEQDDLSRATRIMRRVRAQVDSLLSHRVAKVTAPGKACANVSARLANELSDIRDLAQGISGHLNDEIGGL